MVVTYIVYPGRSYYGVKGRGYCTLAPAPVGGPKIKSRTPFLSDGPRKQIGSVVSGTSRFLVPLGCTKKSKPTPHVFF